MKKIDWDAESRKTFTNFHEQAVAAERMGREFLSKLAVELGEAGVDYMLIHDEIVITKDDAGVAPEILFRVLKGLT